MVNEFPTYPQVLAEASPMSLSDLALMSPDEMSPEAELAYIAELRAYRERYERAMGAPKARALGGTKAKAASVILDGAFGGGADASSDVEF
jgi:hypothetical protein